jgi:hypothetical protein
VEVTQKWNPKIHQILKKNQTLQDNGIKRSLRQNI